MRIGCNMARRYILLDLDGTLVDSRPGIFRCFRDTLSKMGERIPDDEELFPVIGPPLRDGFSRFISDPAKIVEAVEIYREMYRAGAMFEAEVYPGIPEELESLSSENDLLCVTSKMHEYAAQIIEKFGLSKYIHKVYGPEPDGTLSEKALLIGHVLESEKISADKAIMVGDTHYDIEGAIANGIRSVGVLWGFGELGDIRRADFIIATPDHLGKAIDYIMK